MRLMLAGAVGLLVGGTCVHAEQAVEPSAEVPGHLEMDFGDGALTLEAQGVPLGDLLAAIGERAGFAVSLRGDSHTPVSVSLAEVSLEEALRKVLGEGSIVFFYDGTQEGSARRLVNVRAVATSSAQPDGDQPEIQALPSEALRADEDAAPLISPFDPLEDRLAFARGQARNAGPKAGEGLMTLLLEDQDVNVRGMAASALGRLGGAEAGEVLVEALVDRDRRVRGRAVRALGRAWGYQAVTPIADMLAEERSRNVRRIAAYALSRIPGEAARQALEPLQSDPDRQVRRIASRALETGQTR